MEYLIVNLLITLINMGLLGLSLKLYTEYFKDKSIDKRHKAKENI